MKWIFICAFLFSMEALADSSQNISVKNLNNILKKEKATWQAKESWMTHLSREETVRMMGALGVEPSTVDFSTLDNSSQAPEVVDWRNRNGQNYVSPVLNQGNCGSCVAFATVGTLETQMNITSVIPALNPKYSTEALFSCGGGRCDGGWYTSSAGRYVVSYGVPDEACAPYTMGATGKDVACRSACGDMDHRSQRAIRTSNPSKIQDVKNALKKGPMITSMYVYEDFVNYGSGVYKHTKGNGLGGHAISLIGFDDNKRAWIIRNSWGNEWGMDGFAYISYDDVSGVGETNIQFEVGNQSAYLWTDVKDRSFISGNKEITVSTSDKNATSWKIMVQSSGANATVAEVNCGSSECKLPINTAGLEDGEYQLTATQGTAELHRYFYISNNVGDYTIKISPKDFKPQNPVNDRIEFALNIKQTGKVPFSRMAFTYQNAKGEVKQKWTDNIAPNMVQGWRTGTVANGKYRVWYVGEQSVGGVTRTFESDKISVDVQN
jgi:C1A family cysteine protease